VGGGSGRWNPRWERCSKAAEKYKRLRIPPPWILCLAQPDKGLCLWESHSAARRKQCKEWNLDW